MSDYPDRTYRREPPKEPWGWREPREPWRSGDDRYIPTTGSISRERPRDIHAGNFYSEQQGRLVEEGMRGRHRVQSTTRESWNTGHRMPFDRRLNASPSRAPRFQTSAIPAVPLTPHHSNQHRIHSGPPPLNVRSVHEYPVSNWNAPPPSRQQYIPPPVPPPAPLPYRSGPDSQRAPLNHRASYTFSNNGSPRSNLPSGPGGMPPRVNCYRPAQQVFRPGADYNEFDRPREPLSRPRSPPRSNWRKFGNTWEDSFRRSDRDAAQGRWSEQIDVNKRLDMRNTANTIASESLQPGGHVQHATLPVPKATGSTAAVSNQFHRVPQRTVFHDPEPQATSNHKEAEQSKVAKVQDTPAVGQDNYPKPEITSDSAPIQPDNSRGFEKPVQPVPATERALQSDHTVEKSLQEPAEKERTETRRKSNKAPASTGGLLINANENTGDGKKFSKSELKLIQEELAREDERRVYTIEEAEQRRLEREKRYRAIFEADREERIKKGYPVKPYRSLEEVRKEMRERRKAEEELEKRQKKKAPHIIPIPTSSHQPRSERPSKSKSSMSDNPAPREEPKSKHAQSLLPEQSAEPISSGKDSTKKTKKRVANVRHHNELILEESQPLKKRKTDSTAKSKEPKPTKQRRAEEPPAASRKEHDRAQRSAEKREARRVAQLEKRNKRREAKLNELVPNAEDRAYISAREEKKHPLGLQRAAFSKYPVEKNYVFVPRGNAYITKRIKTYTFAARKPFYVVRNGRSTSAYIGYQCPAGIYKRAAQHEEESRYDRTRLSMNRKKQIDRCREAAMVLDGMFKYLPPVQNDLIISRLFENPIRQTTLPLPEQLREAATAHLRDSFDLAAKLQTIRADMMTYRGAGSSKRNKEMDAEALRQAELARERYCKDKWTEWGAEEGTNHTTTLRFAQAQTFIKLARERGKGRDVKNENAHNSSGMVDDEPLHDGNGEDGDGEDDDDISLPDVDFDDVILSDPESSSTSSTSSDESGSDDEVQDLDESGIDFSSKYGSHSDSESEREVRPTSPRPRRRASIRPSPTSSGSSSDSSAASTSSSDTDSDADSAHHSSSDSHHTRKFQHDPKRRRIVTSVSSDDDTSSSSDSDDGGHIASIPYRRALHSLHQRRKAKTRPQIKQEPNDDFEAVLPRAQDGIVDGDADRDGGMDMDIDNDEIDPADIPFSSDTGEEEEAERKPTVTPPLGSNSRTLDRGRRERPSAKIKREPNVKQEPDDEDEAMLEDSRPASRSKGSSRVMMEPRWVPVFYISD